MSANTASPPERPGEDAADRFFLSNDARLRYRDQGRGPAVLLVHGWTLDLEMWEPQVGALGGAFRVVRLDRRGHGRSSGVPEPESDAGDLAALCRFLELERVALIGMSQGARAVLGFVASAPQSVSCLILDGPPDLDSGGAADELPIEHYRRLVQSAGIEAFRRTWAGHPLMQLRTSDPRIRALLGAMIRRYPGLDLSQVPASAAPAAPAAKLDSVGAPALVISGEFDLPGRLRAAQRLCQRLKRAEHAVIPGAGHLPSLDNPGCYNSLCRAFLDRHASQAALP